MICSIFVYWGLVPLEIRFLKGIQFLWGIWFSRRSVSQFQLSDSGVVQWVGTPGSHFLGFVPALNSVVALPQNGHQHIPGTWEKTYWGAKDKFTNKYKIVFSSNLPEERHADPDSWLIRIKSQCHLLIRRKLLQFIISFLSRVILVGFLRESVGSNADGESKHTDVAPRRI